MIQKLVLFPLYWLSKFEYRYIAIFLLLLAGPLTAIEQLSFFFNGAEYFVFSGVSIQNFIWISCFFGIFIRTVFFLDFDFSKYEKWAIWYLIFLLYCLFTIFWTDYPGNAFRDFMQMSFPFLIYMIGFKWVSTNNNAVNYIMRSFWFGLIIMIALTVVVAIQGRPLFGVDYGGVQRFWGPMGWSALGYYLLPYCVAAFGLALMKGSRRHYMLLACVLIVFAITLGRLSSLALFVAFIVIYLYWRGDLQKKVRLGLIGCFLAMVASVYVLPSIIERTFSATGEFQWSGRTNSAEYISGRVESSYVTSVLGNGAGTARSVSEELIGISSEVRSKYFIIYSDYGVVGLFLYVVSLLLLLLSSVRLLSKQSERYFRISGDDGATQGLSLLVLRVGAVVSIIIIGAFDNLTFIYLTSLYFLLLCGSGTLVKNYND